MLYHLLVLLAAAGRGARRRDGRAGTAHGAERPRREGARGRRRLTWTRPPPRRSSPHRVFTRAEWAKLRADTPLTLTEADLDAAEEPQRPDLARRGGRDLPAAVAPAQPLRRRRRRACTTRPAPSSARATASTPFIIGIAGSVAVGKSTTARVLRALLRRWPNTPKVELITTDGFLLPNAVLDARRADGAQGLPRELRPAGAARLPADDQGRRAQRHGAGLFASHLRHRARARRSPSTGPTS